MDILAIGRMPFAKPAIGDPMEPRQAEENGFGQESLAKAKPTAPQASGQGVEEASSKQQIAHSKQPDFQLAPIGARDADSPLDSVSSQPLDDSAPEPYQSGKPELSTGTNLASHSGAHCFFGAPEGCAFETSMLSGADVEQSPAGSAAADVKTPRPIIAFGGSMGQTIEHPLPNFDLSLGRSSGIDSRGEIGSTGKPAILASGTGFGLSEGASVEIPLPIGAPNSGPSTGIDPRGESGSTGKPVVLASGTGFGLSDGARVEIPLPIGTPNSGPSTGIDPRGESASAGKPVILSSGTGFGLSEGASVELPLPIGAPNSGPSTGIDPRGESGSTGKPVVLASGTGFGVSNGARIEHPLPGTSPTPPSSGAGSQGVSGTARGDLAASSDDVAVTLSVANTGPEAPPSPVSMRTDPRGAADLLKSTGEVRQSPPISISLEGDRPDNGADGALQRVPLKATSTGEAGAAQTQLAEAEASGSKPDAGMGLGFAQVKSAAAAGNSGAAASEPSAGAVRPHVDEVAGDEAAAKSTSFEAEGKTETGFGIGAGIRNDAKADSSNQSHDVTFGTQKDQGSQGRTDASALVRQLADRIEQLAAIRPRDGVRIRLEPEYLGSVTIVVRGGRSNVEAELGASNPDVKAALEANRQHLAAALEARGYHLAAITVDVQQESASSSTGADSRTQSEQHGETGARAFHGNRALVSDAAPPKLSWASSTGVDIWI